MKLLQIKMLFNSFPVSTVDRRQCLPVRRYFWNTVYHFSFVFLETNTDDENRPTDCYLCLTVTLKALMHMVLNVFCCSMHHSYLLYVASVT